MSSNVNVSSTVTLNTAILDRLTKQQYVSLAQSADAILTDIKDSQVMPFNTGQMQNASTHVDDSQAMSGRVSIVTTAPQARRLYFHPEYNFRKTNNSRAGGKWFDGYVGSGRIAEIYGEIFKRNGGL